MRRTIVFETKEVPEEIVDLLAVNILEMKELKRFMFKKIREEIEKKGVRGAVEEIWKAAYGKEWREKVDDKVALLEKILRLSEVGSGEIKEKETEVVEEKAKVGESREKVQGGSDKKGNNKEFSNKLKNKLKALK